MNEISVPKKQKIIAYIFLFLVIITFSTMRSNKIKKHIDHTHKYTQAIETSIQESIMYLYNNDLEKTNCNYIDTAYKEKLINKFKNTNSLMSKESLKLSYIKFNDKKLYKTDINGEPFVIYNGLVDLKWSYTNKDSSTDITTKEITVYITDSNDTPYIADIQINDKK